MLVTMKVKADMKALLKYFIPFIGVLIHVNGFSQTTATSTAVLFNGFVVGVTINSGGSGYTYPPSVTFSGGGGSGAGAYSVVSNGVVTQVVVTNAGGNYTSTPNVVISAPVTGNYSFRSGSAYVQIPDSISLDSTTNQLTIECWFNRVTNPGLWNSLISRDTTSLTSVDYELRFNGNQPVGTLHLASGNPDISGLTVNANPGFPTWHHYALEFDGTNCSIWLDGELVFSLTNAPGQMALSYDPLTIGCQNSGVRPFDGYIDEVRISKIARYHSIFNPSTRFSPDVNTIALYHFDENGGSTAYDSSGNGNNGTIYNVGPNTWSTNVPPVLSGALLSVNKAVYLSFANLTIGTNYQVQISTSMSGVWSNFGTPFTATNTMMVYSNVWNVSDWNALFFRLAQ
jgi:hypothetical protein